ncbi:MAG: LysM peptidoglycan-binding domain-containing protein [Chloroflexota bacterium]
MASAVRHHADNKITVAHASNDGSGREEARDSYLIFQTSISDSALRLDHPSTLKVAAFAHITSEDIQIDRKEGSSAVLEKIFLAFEENTSSDLATRMTDALNIAYDSTYNVTKLQGNNHRTELSILIAAIYDSFLHLAWLGTPTAYLVRKQQIRPLLQRSDSPNLVTGYYRQHALQPDDKVILCSWEMAETLTAGEIQSIVVSKAADDAASNLVALSAEKAKQVRADVVIFHYRNRQLGSTSWLRKPRRLAAAATLLAFILGSAAMGFYTLTRSQTQLADEGRTSSSQSSEPEQDDVTEEQQMGITTNANRQVYTIPVTISLAISEVNEQLQSISVTEGLTVTSIALPSPTVLPSMSVISSSTALTIPLFAQTATVRASSAITVTPTNANTATAIPTSTAVSTPQVASNEVATNTPKWTATLSPTWTTSRLPTATAMHTPSSSATPTPEPTPATYTIKPGDNLSRIGRELDLTVDQLLEQNPALSRGSILRVGQQLKLPPTPTPIPYISIQLESTPDHWIAAGQEVTYRIIYRNEGTVPVSDIVLQNAVPANTILVWDSLDEGNENVSVQQRDHGLIIWRHEQLAPQETGHLSYRVQRLVAPSPTAAPLAISLWGPSEALSSELLTYTLAITNASSIAIEILTVTNRLPDGINYIRGGSYREGQLNWIINGLQPKQRKDLHFVISSYRTIVFSDFHVRSDDGLRIKGSSIFMTTIDELPPYDGDGIALLNDGVRVQWQLNGQTVKTISNKVRNPPFDYLYLPVIAQ